MASTGHTLGSLSPDPSPEEAAALIGALERFLSDTLVVLDSGAATGLDPWRRAALLEGVRRAPVPAAPEPWINR